MTVRDGPPPPAVSAVAFDPTGTVSVAVFPPPFSSKTTTSADLNVLVSHDGTGCGPQETECLLRCIDAHRRSSSSRRTSPALAATMSMDYRAAVRDCIASVERRREGEEMDGMNDDTNDDGGRKDDLVSLRLTHAVIHLAEIFLLPSSEFRGTTRRLDGPPGSLTADVVRYLRLHHADNYGDMLYSSSTTYFDAPWVQSMLKDDQPEYYKMTQSDDIPSLAVGPYEYPYWNLLLHMVVRGELSIAWTLLSHHSAVKMMSDGEEGGGLHEISPEAEGFGALRAILLSAPIPGGRGEMNDDDVDVEAPLIDGVPPGADLLWESNPRRLRTVDYSTTASQSILFPEFYQPQAAMNAFTNWQDNIRIVAFPSGGGVMSALFRRFPALQQLVSILVGMVPSSIVAAREWSDILLMELLYSRPNIMPEDIAARAKVAMSSIGVGGRGNANILEEIVLSIMNGNAGKVVEAMFTMCGGSSGAALPATLTSLLCNLLVDTGCITSQQDESFNIQTDLLVLAAEAISSSFSVQGQANVGVRTAVVLLLPYSLPKRGADRDVVYEPRIAHMIAQLLSHRLPATDAETRDLLQLCEEVVRLGSIPIADACESLAYSRALHYRSNSNISREVYWLLRGMEIQSSWLPSDRQRKLGFACRRHFDSLCERSTDTLVSMLSISAVANLTSAGLSDIQEVELTKALKSAGDVMDGILQVDNMALVLRGHMESNLLKYAIDIADAKGDTSQVATDIVNCLEERCLSDEYGGVVATLADPSSYSDFLLIAFALLTKEDEHSKGLPMDRAKCAFTLHGMHILLARLTQVMAWEEISCASGESKRPSDARNKYFEAMRLVFCKSLMRVISDQPSVKKSGSKMRASLEEEVEFMLSPCI